MGRLPRIPPSSPAYANRVRLERPLPTGHWHVYDGYSITAPEGHTLPHYFNNLDEVAAFCKERGWPVITAQQKGPNHGR